jgi:hypothetical protein
MNIWRTQRLNRQSLAELKSNVDSSETRREPALAAAAHQIERDFPPGNAVSTKHHLFDAGPVITLRRHREAGGRRHHGGARRRPAWQVLMNERDR